MSEVALNSPLEAREDFFRKFGKCKVARLVRWIRWSRGQPESGTLGQIRRTQTGTRDEFNERGILSEKAYRGSSL